MKSADLQKSRKRMSGQVVVEYVLLLAIGVSIALVIITQLIKRDSSDVTNSGAIIKKWYQIQQDIGKDNQN